MPAYSLTLLATPGPADVADDGLEPQYCVGNSHALVVVEFDEGTAECECGGLLRAPRDDDRHWNAELVHDATGILNCPAYSCRGCKRRHNEPAAS